MGIIDYATNLDVADNGKRFYEYRKLIKMFGYLPVYGPRIEDINYGKQLLGFIVSAYPGYRWVIEVRDSVISVVNETLAPDWGFRLKVHMLDNDGVVICRFAGELLERYEMKRAGLDYLRLAEAPRDLRGNVLRAV